MNKQQYEWVFKFHEEPIADTGDSDSYVRFTNSKDILQASGEEMDDQDCQRFCMYLNKMPDLWSHRTDAVEFENGILKKENELLKARLKEKAGKQEFILCSAIHYKNGSEPNVKGIESGVVVPGRRHGDCYKVLNGLLPDANPADEPPRDDQGFLTSHNRYVSRKEAFRIAKANNQIWHKLFDGVDEGSLASEDLY